MERLSDLCRRHGSAHWLWLIGTVALVIFTSQQLRARRVYEVAKPTENIRSSPEGLRLGVLEKGTEIEEVGRDGQWVKFEIVAWIWGPSLDGFEEAGVHLDRSDASGTVASSSPQESKTDNAREPRQALNLHLEEVRDLVNEDFGRFYGLSLKAETGVVMLRFRVPDVGERVLWQRQMLAQARVDAILKEEVRYNRLRVETNRPDGTGAVGQFVAVADTATIRRIAGEDLDAWLKVAERSADGGKTWE